MSRESVQREIDELKAEIRLHRNHVSAFQLRVYRKRLAQLNKELKALPKPTPQPLPLWQQLHQR